MKDIKNPTIEIIAVGSELLTPSFLDTNSLYLTGRLNSIGLSVSYKSIVGDDERSLRRCLKDAAARSDLVITIGGLGPTEDDRTRETCASVMGRRLVFHEEILQSIEKRFNRRKLKMPSVNKKQAFVMEGAEVLRNEHGTAPGLWIETESNIFALLPGPPHEFKPMVDLGVLPRLEKLTSTPIERKILKITGLTESKIENLITDLYTQTKNVEISILAKPGQIEVHLTGIRAGAMDIPQEEIQGLEDILTQRLGDHVFSTAGEELEEVAGHFLRREKKTLAVAESCTGGLLGHRVTNVPGSSEYFLQGVVAYSDHAKISRLGVPGELIEKFGAVSKEIAGSMAYGIRKTGKADFGLSITGIAGPSGGTSEKPVGLVYTGLAWDGGEKVLRNLFLGTRETIKFQSSQKALDMLRRHLLKLD